MAELYWWPQGLKVRLSVKIRVLMQQSSEHENSQLELVNDYNHHRHHQTTSWVHVAAADRDKNRCLLRCLNKPTEAPTADGKWML